MTIIKLLPRIVRLALFDHISNQINEVSVDDVETFKGLVIAQLARLLRL